MMATTRNLSGFMGRIIASSVLRSLQGLLAILHTASTAELGGGMLANTSAAVGPGTPFSHTVFRVSCRSDER